MEHYYVTLPNYEKAEQLVEDLEKQGIPREKIDIVVKQDNTVEVDETSLTTNNQSIEQAPEGTISTFGALFTPIAAATAGILLAATGPVAAIIGGGAVAAGGMGVLMSGYGVPEEETQTVLNKLESGHIMVHIKDTGLSSLEEIFNRYH